MQLGFVAADMLFQLQYMFLCINCCLCVATSAWYV